MKKTEPIFITLGCRLNAYETAVMKKHSTIEDVQNCVFVHSCAVTHEAERQSLQAVRRARRAYPHARVVVTGCSAQIHPERYLRDGTADYVVGNDGKLAQALYQHLRTQSARPEKPIVWMNNDTDDKNNTKGSEPLLDDFFGRARAFVAVQNGCDHDCTFCIIPQGRGQHRSLPIDAVVRQCEALVRQGFREIVLTGVDIASWGREWGGCLGDLVDTVLQRVTELRRLRLSSLDPACIDARLLDCFATHPHMLPFIHLSVQSGDDMILKRMKRRHRRRDVIALCEHLRRRRSDIVFGADMIAGFPTENAVMHENSLTLLEQADLVLNHIFPYSPRSDTKAARMPMVAPHLRRLRATRLHHQTKVLKQRLLHQFIGRTISVLIENGKKGIGRSDHYIKVRFEPTEKCHTGDLIDMHCARQEQDYLYAVVP